MKRWLPIHDKIFERLREVEKLPNPVISKRMGFSCRTLCLQAKRLGFERRPLGPQRGIKFYPERDAQLVQDAKSGMSMQELQSKYGLGPQRINQIRRQNNG